MSIAMKWLSALAATVAVWTIGCDGLHAAINQRGVGRAQVDEVAVE